MTEETFNPLDFIDVPDFKRTDDGMELYVQLLRSDVPLKVPERLIRIWAEFDGKLADEMGERIPFEVYYHAQMQFDPNAVDDLAKHILKYYYEECK